MFIAMNRFQVKKGSEDAFEQMWKSRDTYLNEMAGFVEFHLLKGPEAEDHTLYSSHTVWESKADVRGVDQVGAVPRVRTPAPATTTRRRSTSSIRSSRASR